MTGLDFIYPEYELVRDSAKCIACRVCERQCANEVTRYDGGSRCNGERQFEMRQLSSLRVAVPRLMRSRL